MKVYIFDLDGTLANCDHRQDFALNKEWDEFHRLCHLDEVYPNIARLLLDLDQSDHAIVIITGRDDRYRQATTDWLVQHGILPSELIMRPEGNRQPDHEFKLAAVDEYFGSREVALANTTCWFEDRDRLTEELRNAGFTVLQVKAGAY